MIDHALTLQDSIGSQQVLLNSEMYGLYIVTSLRSDIVNTGNKTEIKLIRENIGERSHNYQYNYTDYFMRQ